METSSAREQIDTQCKRYYEFDIAFKDLIYPLLASYSSTYDAKRTDGTTPFTRAFYEYHNDVRHRVMTLTGKGAFEKPGNIFPFIVQDRRPLTADRFSRNPNTVFTSPPGALASIFGEYPRNVHMDTYHTNTGIDTNYRGQLAHYWNQTATLGISLFLAATSVQELTARQLQKKTVEAIAGKISRAEITTIPEDEIEKTVHTYCDRLYHSLGYQYLTQDLVKQALAELCPGHQEAVYPLFQAIVHMETRIRKAPISNNTLRGPVLRAIDKGDVGSLKSSIAASMKADPTAFKYSHHFCKDFPDLMETYRKAVAE